MSQAGRESSLLARYWEAYGGCRKLRRSGYLYAAVLLTLVGVNYWWNRPWWEMVLAVVPNLLGFTLGGFALFLGFADERFRTNLLDTPVSDNPESVSVYHSVAATFLHFLLLQSMALVLGIIGNVVHFSPRGWLLTLINATHTRASLKVAELVLGGLGFLVFVYAVLCGMAVALGVYRLATWVEATHRISAGPPPPKDKNELKMLVDSLVRSAVRNGTGKETFTAEKFRSRAGDHAGEVEECLAALESEGKLTSEAVIRCSENHEVYRGPRDRVPPNLAICHGTAQSRIEYRASVQYITVVRTTG